MKKVPLIVFLSILLVSCRSKEVVTDSTSFSPVDYVNPLVEVQLIFAFQAKISNSIVRLPHYQRKILIRSLNSPNSFSPGSAVGVPKGISAISIQLPGKFQVRRTSSSISGL